MSTRFTQLLIGSYNETVTCLSHSTSGSAFFNKFSSDHCAAMLEKWERALAAAWHATSKDREEHSVSKGYGAQTREQRSKAMLQKALSGIGKELINLYDDNPSLRSVRNKIHWSLRVSSVNFQSQQISFRGKHRPCEKGNSCYLKPRSTLHRIRSSHMTESHVNSSTSDARVAISSKRLYLFFP